VYIVTSALADNDRPSLDARIHSTLFCNVGTKFVDMFRIKSQFKSCARKFETRARGFSTTTQRRGNVGLVIFGRLDYMLLLLETICRLLYRMGQKHVQCATLMQTFKTKLNGFHQNVHRIHTTKNSYSFLCSSLVVHFSKLAQILLYPQNVNPDSSVSVIFVIW